MRSGPQIAVEGLREFQRDVRKLQPELRREVPTALREATERVVLPVSRARTPRRTGRLAASERVVARGNSVSITSRLPYANVVHWGGSAGRGHSPSRPGAVRFKASLFAVRAVEDTAGRLVGEIARELDHVFRRNGWG